MEGRSRAKNQLDLFSRFNRTPTCDRRSQQGPSQDLEEGHSMLRIFGCQTMHNFVYLAIVHEPLVKHEKNLGCSACLFAELSSNRNTSMKNVITYVARNLYFVFYSVSKCIL